MTTIRDVARVAGASTATVSHVLNGSRFVSAETKKSGRGRDTGAQLSPSWRCAQPSTQPDRHHRRDDFRHRQSLFRRSRARSRRRRPSRRRSATISFSATPGKVRKGADVFRRVSQKRVDGLILASAGGNAETVRDMIARGMPIVCVDRELAGVEADTIVVDNRAAAQTMVRHLIAVGHRHIVALRAACTRIR